MTTLHSSIALSGSFVFDMARWIIFFSFSFQAYARIILWCYFLLLNIFFTSLGFLCMLEVVNEDDAGRVGEAVKSFPSFYYFIFFSSPLLVNLYSFLLHLGIFFCFASFILHFFLCAHEVCMNENSKELRTRVKWCGFIWSEILFPKPPILLFLCVFNAKVVCS